MCIDQTEVYIPMYINLVIALRQFLGVVYSSPGALSDGSWEVKCNTQPSNPLNFLNHSKVDRALTSYLMYLFCSCHTSGQ
jgi:hypothetical protein